MIPSRRRLTPYFLLTLAAATGAAPAQQTINYADGEVRTININTSPAAGGDATLNVPSGSAKQGPIAGTGSIIKTGDGTLILGYSQNQYQGPTTINAGVLSVDYLYNRLGGYLGRSDDSASSLVIDGGTLQITAGASAYRLFTVGSNGATISQVGSPGGYVKFFNTGSLAMGGAANARTLTLTGTSSGYFAPVILDSGTGANVTSVVKSGTGSWQLYGTVANTYTGLTSVTGGELSLNKTAGVNAIAGDIEVNGGTLKWLASNQVADTSHITLSSGAVQLNGQTETTSNLTNSGGTFTTGAGHLTTNGAVTFSGGTNTVNNGGSVAGNPLIITGGTNTVEGGATGGVLYSGGLDITGANLTLNSDDAVAGKLSIMYGYITSHASATPSTISSGLTGANRGQIDLGGALRTFNVEDGAAASDLTISAVITNGGLVKVGAGTLVLDGANTYGDNTYIGGGTLSVSLLANAGTPSGIGQLGFLGIDGGTLKYTGPAVSSNQRLTIYSGATLDASGSGAINFTSIGTLQATPGGRKTLTLTGTNTGSNTLAANIPGSGFTLGVTKSGTGQWVLSGNSSYNGVTTINGGTLSVSTLVNGSTVSNIGRSTNAAANLVIDGGNLRYTGGATSTDRNFTMGASGAAIEASGTGAINFTSTGSIAMGSSGSDRTLLLHGTNTGANTLAAIITDNGSGANTTSLTKAGSGQWILSGASTYTGATAITGGKLVVNGSLGNTAVNVESGATLGGSGAIAGEITVQSGGVLAPGNSPGTLSVGGLVLNSGSILNYELNTAGIVGGGVNDLIAVGGNLTLDGVMNITGLPNFGAGTYTLFTYGSTLTDNGPALGVTPAGYVYAITTGAGEVNLQVGTTGLYYWNGAVTSPDGVVHGGDGTWASGTTNWTDHDGSVSQAWFGTTAVFSATAGTVTVDGTQNITGLQFTTDGYTITGGTLDAGATAAELKADPGVTATIASTLTGTGGLTETGSGTIILSGINTYLGGTTITTGTLQISADANLGDASGGVIISEGTLATTASFSTARAIALGNLTSTLSTASGTTLTATGELSGMGLVKDGLGTLAITGLGSSVGNIYVHAGTLEVSGGGALSSAVTAIGDTVGSTGAVTVTGTNSSLGNTFLLSVGDTGTGSLAISNGGGVTNYYGAVGAAEGSNGTVTVDGAGSSWTTDNFLTVGDSGTGSVTVSNGASLSAFGSILGANVEGTGTVTVNSGSFTNTAVLTVGAVGTGTVTQTGGNITAPTVTVADQAGSTGTLNLNGGLFTTGQVAFGAGTATVNFDGGTLKLTGDQPALFGSSGSVTINAGGGTIDIQSYNVATATSFHGTGGLTKLGTGTLTLTGTADYVGATTIQAGTLTLGTGGVLVTDQLAKGVGTGSFGFDGGKVKLTGDQGDLFNGFGSVALGSGGGTIDTQGHTVSTGVILTGAGGLTKSGAGSLIVDGVNTYTGATTINAGTLVLGDNGDITASSGVNLTSAGAAFDVSGNGISAIQDLTGVAGTSIQLGANILTLGTANSTTFAGVLEDGGIMGAIAKQGTGTLTLTGTNTYVCETYIYEGTLAIGPDGSIATSCEVRVYDESIFDISNGGNQTVLDFYGYSGGTTRLGENTLTLGTADDSFADGTIEGTGGLVKQGEGTFTVSGLLDYTGATVINEGTMEAFADDVFASASAHTVGSLGKLDLSDHNETIGSLAGAGKVALGTGRLTTGGDNTSTSFSGQISGTGGLTKTGTGTFTISGTNIYGGATIIAQGTLQLGAADALSTATAIQLTGGTFDLNGYSPEVFTSALTVAGSGSTLDFGLGHLGGVTVEFGDSSGVNWTSNLTLLHFTVDTDELGFTLPDGLTSTQLTLINLEGYTAIGLDAEGFVQFEVAPVPEPTVALIIPALLGLMGFVYWRRSKVPGSQLASP